MHALTVTAHARRTRILVAVGAALVTFVAMLSSPGVASAKYCTQPINPIDRINSCYIPIKGSYSFSVPLSAATQSASGLPGDPGGTGQSNITLNLDANTVCATTSWSGLHSPVMVGHIHGGAYGQPEDPAVTLTLTPPPGLNGLTSPASACTPLPPGEAGLIAECPQQFEVVLHSQQHAYGAIRGQMGTACNII
jgi:hypothetical protein